MSDFSVPTKAEVAPKPRKLLDQVRDAIRLKQYSLRTEQAYVDWVKRFILVHKKTTPKTMIYTHVMNKPGLATPTY